MRRLFPPRSLTSRQLAVDLSIAAICAFLGYATYSTGVSVSSVIILGMATGLGVRRLNPSAALATVWVTAILQLLVGADPEASNLAILPVLYASAAYGGRTLKWLGLASAVVGAMLVALYLAALPALTEYLGGVPDDSRALPALAGAVITFVGVGVVFVLSWTFGLLAKTFSAARDSRRAQLAAEEQRARAVTETIVEQERTRIARDMHDVVAHSLAVVIAQADGARYAGHADPRVVDEALTTISSTARDALGDVRVLLGQLRHSQAAGPQPALDDLDRLLDQVRASGLDVVSTQRGEARALPTGQQMAVYRIVQESLTNALRHGDPAHPVAVDLDWSGGALLLTITSRLSVALTEIRPGHGLAGMRERATLVGGWFTATAAGETFIVRASLPVSQETTP